MINLANKNHFDVIVIGGGHAGTEAALAASRMKAKTLLLTHNIETLGQMSCNPAIGGIGKGHLVKEIDALGGIMGQAIDRAGIQFRILNRSKGAAVRATRAQADRSLYKQVIREAIENQENLWVFQQPVDDLILDNEVVTGVITQSGVKFFAKSIVITVGTFLGGKIHIGSEQYAGGRAGDIPSIALAKKLRNLPFRVGRLKTGTPPRIDKRSIDFSKLEQQMGDNPRPNFSFWNDNTVHPAQLNCYITHTNTRTHEIIQESLHLSAMYGGHIESVGPRYCPSIEDKIVRFAKRESHQVFLEPEGLRVNEVYPNGISTSLPFDVQIDFVRSMVGLANAHITRPGYAIEYDYLDPRDLTPTLESKIIKNLFLAGQINGTTGYEEAAAQGIIAGINAARRAFNLPYWYPKRSEAYMGVLIDDLTTMGASEPYRMFTSRSEYRLQLREDNADLRLTPVGRELGLIDDFRWRLFVEKQESLAQEMTRINKTFIHPNTQQAEQFFHITGEKLEREYSLASLLKRSNVSYDAIALISPSGHNLTAAVHEQIEIQSRYGGYIKRQELEIAKMTKNETMLIPGNINYGVIPGLSAEICEKLTKIKPYTIGQARRIQGVTPAAISLLLIYLKKLKKDI